MTTPLVNGTPVTVKLKSGAIEVVSIIELSIRQLYIFIKHLGGADTPALVALCANKPAEWIDTLTDESFDELVAISIKQNFQRAANRAKNDPVALAKIGPMLLELEPLARRMAIETSGPSGSGSPPTPAPEASAAATGSV